MTDITTMNQLPTKRPRGRPRKYVTEEERLEIKRANDRRYYNENSETKKEKVKEYQAANKEYILQRKRDLYHQKKNMVNQSKSNNSDLISGLS